MASSVRAPSLQGVEGGLEHLGGQLAALLAVERDAARRSSPHAAGSAAGPPPSRRCRAAAGPRRALASTWALEVSGTRPYAATAPARSPERGSAAGEPERGRREGRVGARDDLVPPCRRSVVVPPTRPPRRGPASAPARRAARGSTRRRCGPACVGASPAASAATPRYQSARHSHGSAASMPSRTVVASSSRPASMSRPGRATGRSPRSSPRTARAGRARRRHRRRPSDRISPGLRVVGVDERRRQGPPRRGVRRPAARRREPRARRRAPVSRSWRDDLAQHADELAGHLLGALEAVVGIGGGRPLEKRVQRVEAGVERDVTRRRQRVPERALVAGEVGAQHGERAADGEQVRGDGRAGRGDLRRLVADRAVHRAAVVVERGRRRRGRSASAEPDVWITLSGLKSQKISPSSCRWPSAGRISRQ